MSEKVVLDNLQRRLGSLTASPSRESIQGLAKWLIFHRRHSVAISDWLLKNYYTQESATNWNKKYLSLCMMHEIFTIYHNIPTLWDRTSDFRSTLSQRVLLPAMDSICRSSVVVVDDDDDPTPLERDQILDDKTRPMLKTWKDWDCFGNNSTLYDDLLQILDHRKEKKETEGGKKQIQNQPKEEQDEIKLTNEQVQSTQELEMESSDKESQKKVNVDDSTVSMDVDNVQKEQDNLTKQIEDNKSETANTKNSDNDDEISNDDQNEAIVTTPIGSDFEMDETNENGNDDDNSNNNEETEEKLSNNSKKRKLDEETKQNEQTKKQEIVTVEHKAEEYDFEKSNVPFRKVATRELVAPSKAIETMQIARDLRNDAAVQLSSLLSNVSPEVYEACSSGEQVDLKTIPTLSDEILDIDITDALENIRMYRDICVKLQKARQKCMSLLIESRCQFGSVEAAKEYYELDGRLEALKKQKGLLNDAMELEGLDFEDDDEDDGDKDDKEIERDSESDDDDIMDMIDSQERNASKHDNANRSAKLEDLTWYLDTLE